MNALKNGRKAAAKMEARIKELENELDAEQRRLGDASKNLRKGERKVKELEFQEEEDRKQHEHMADLVDKLQQKVIKLLLKLTQRHRSNTSNMIPFTAPQLQEAD